MPAPHHSDFYGPDALPLTPNQHVKALKAYFLFFDIFLLQYGIFVL